MLTLGLKQRSISSEIDDIILEVGVAGATPSLFEVLLGIGLKGSYLVLVVDFCEFCLKLVELL